MAHHELVAKNGTEKIYFREKARVATKVRQLSLCQIDSNGPVPFDSSQTTLMTKSLLLLHGTTCGAVLGGAVGLLFSSVALGAIPGAALGFILSFGIQAGRVRPVIATAAAGAVCGLLGSQGIGHPSFDYAIVGAVAGAALSFSHPLFYSAVLYGGSAYLILRVAPFLLVEPRAAAKIADLAGIAGFLAAVAGAAITAGTRRNSSRPSPFFKESMNESTSEESTTESE